MQSNTQLPYPPGRKKVFENLGPYSEVTLTTPRLPSNAISPTRRPPSSATGLMIDSGVGLLTTVALEGDRRVVW